MPKPVKADSALREYEAACLHKVMKSRKNIQARCIYSADSLKWTVGVKQVRKKVLSKLTGSTGMEQEAQKRYPEKTAGSDRSLQKKAYDAIQAVAKRLVYTYV